MAKIDEGFFVGRVDAAVGHLALLPLLLRMNTRVCRRKKTINKSINIGLRLI